MSEILRFVDSNAWGLWILAFVALCIFGTALHKIIDRWEAPRE